MKKSITSLLLLISIFVYSQEDFKDVVEVTADTIVYNKNTNTIDDKTFSPNLKDKYSGKDFEYTKEEAEKEEGSSPINSELLQFLVFFMSKIFPFLLAGFLIYIILKFILGFDINFWKSGNATIKKDEKLIYEDEDIHQIDLATLLKQAIDNENYRLAIRYYYLSTLKGLSTKKLIDYHKDKTNSEYLFEIENTELRNHFSYLSYVYNYVWYGEFMVDEQKFKSVQNKYQSFLKAIL